MKANLNQITRAIDAVSPDVRLYLLYGPDEAGARDVATRLARALGPEAERVDLEPSQLKSSPGLLADEAASLSLFGTARHIRVTGAGEESVAACTMLLAAERGGNPVVVISPGAKASSALVKLATADPRAMVCAFYVPDAGEADKLATSIAREQGLRTTGSTAGRIAVAAAGDRAVMTRELEKIALYLDAAPERPRELDDATLDAIGADLGDAEMSRAIEAAIDGGPDRLADELARLDVAGSSPIPLLRQLVRRLMAISEMRAEIDAGANANSLIERVFFRERAATTRALRIWSAPALSAAIDRVRRAERATMAPNNAGNVLADQAIVAVARIAARQNS
ncbi:DNA polymerase III subunit delta [Sphingomonas sp. PAMC 26621]|uniref:DNA polymerase III subunit delta n=1 Tax=Sphingomonas sp. PAMC 26621 TaxID=1112213 RepID=UPI000287FE14|nr:DNA polymerase III subunit delta [Sphingomonas sp. PAMC 26621]